MGILSIRFYGLLVCLSLVLIKVLIQSPSALDTVPIIFQKPPPSDATPMKYIFYATDLYTGSWDYLFGYEDRPFRDGKCKNSNCYLTKDNFNPIAPHKYSAFFFHGRDLCSPGQGDRLKALRESTSAPFIFFLIESPAHDCAIDFNRFSHFFNWTMTYRKSSDIPLPYGRIRKLNLKENNLPIDIKSKKKFAFWIVNHLKSQGERDRYVDKLQKVVKIDIYGNGRKLRCPKESRNLYGPNCKITLAKDYKFFLAFENSLCQDYVTEKFFDILELPVVPIVYGRANYSSIAPPHSFIDVRDFKSPEELGKYLLYLNDNEEEYVKYFKWKEEFGVSNLRAASKEVLCELCHRLNHIQDYKKVAYSGREMEKWWRGESPNSSICVSADKIIPGM